MPNKEGETLRKALAECWISTFGPMGELIYDGESGIVRDVQTRQYIQRLGTKLIKKAPGQHAWHVERRGALVLSLIHI